MKNLMKRLAATAFCLALLPLTDCGDDNTDDPLIPPPSDAPVIEAATPAAVPAEGGAISIDYEVKNPVEGKRLSAQSDDAWVKELTVGDEAVTARLEKNLLADPRTATVTLRYDGAEAVKVSVVQEGYLPFLIQVADITMSDARITVYPEEEGMYIAAVDFAEGFDAQKIAAENKAIFAEHAAAEQKTLAEFIAGYAYKGEQTFHPSRLSPKSDYVVYAYGVDAEGNATTDVIVEPFASLPVEPGPKIDCTISITTANLTSSTVDVTFKPTDPTVTYFYTMVDKAGYDDISKDWPAYIYEYMVSRWEKTPSLSLEDIVGICCVTGEWTSEGRELTPKTTYYACAVGVNAQAQINTDVTVVEIVTPEETPIDYAFDFAVSDITANGATVTVTPHDVRAFYYWNVMTEAEYRELGRDEAKIAVWFEQMMDKKRIEQFGEYADMFVPLADYIYSQCSKDGNPETYTFGKLSSSTTYYPYAFWVDEITGKIVSSTSFAEKPFTTPERVVSSAEAAPAAWITDGDDWARLDATKYGSYAGKAVLGARLTPNGDAVHWYSNIYNAADAESLSDEEWTSELIGKQPNKDKKSYNVLSPVEWGGEYVILSVAVDAAGNAGPVGKFFFSAAKEGAEPLESIPGE